MESCEEEPVTQQAPTHTHIHKTKATAQPQKHAVNQRAETKEQEEDKHDHDEVTCVGARVCVVRLQCTLRTIFKSDSTPHSEKNGHSSIQSMRVGWLEITSADSRA